MSSSDDDVERLRNEEVGRGVEDAGGKGKLFFSDLAKFRRSDRW